MPQQNRGNNNVAKKELGSGRPASTGNAPVGSIPPPANAVSHGVRIDQQNAYDAPFESLPAASAGQAQWTPQSFYSNPAPNAHAAPTPGVFGYTAPNANNNGGNHRLSEASGEPDDTSCYYAGQALDNDGFGISGFPPELQAEAEAEAEAEVEAGASPSRRRSDSIGRSARNDKRSSAACIPCRRRKRRCDGVKPVCSTCQRSSSRQCTWDTSGDRRKPVNKSMQIALQTRIEALEAQVDSYRQQAISPGNKGKAKASEAQSGGGPAPWDEMATPMPRRLRSTDPRHGARSLCAESHRLMRNPAALGTSATAQQRQTAKLNAVFSHAFATLFTRMPRSLLEHCLFHTFDHGIAPGRLVPRPVFFGAFVRQPEARSHAYSTFLLGSMLCLGAAYQLGPYPDSLFASSSSCHSPDRSDREMSLSDADGGVEPTLRSTFPDLHGQRDPAAIAHRFWTTTNSLVSAELRSPLLSTVCGLVGLVMTCLGQGKEPLGAMYLDMALSICHSMSLHHDHSHRPHELDRLHTLTFWSCFWVETILAMRQDRPSRFHTAEIRCQLPPVQPELDATFPHFISEGYRYQCQLFCIASDILRVLHNVDGDCIVRGEGGRGGELEQITSLDLRLERWYNELPSGLRASSTSPTALPEAHLVCLSTFYYLVSLTLHATFLDHAFDDLSRFSRVKASRSVCEVVRLVKWLERTKEGKGLKRCNPFLFMPLTKAAECLIALMKIGGEGEAMRTQRERGLETLQKALRQVGTVWEAAKADEEVLALARCFV